MRIKVSLCVDENQTFDFYITSLFYCVDDLRRYIYLCAVIASPKGCILDHRFYLLEAN